MVQGGEHLVYVWRYVKWSTYFGAGVGERGRKSRGVLTWCVWVCGWGRREETYVCVREVG